MKTPFVLTITAAASSLIMVATPAIAAPATEPRAGAAVRFSGAYFDSPGSDSGSNSSLNAEWVRVTNHSAKARSLTGWSVRDVAGHVYRFPSFTLRSGASVKIHTGHGSNTRRDLYWRQDWYVWNNDGDKAILKTKGGTRVDVCKWSGAGSYTGC